MTRTLRSIPLCLFAALITLFSTEYTQAQCPVVIQSIVATDVTCNGANDGTITITISGGFPTYTYQIFNGPFFQSSGQQVTTTFQFTGLGAGVSDYQIIVVGQNGVGGSCPGVLDFVTINDPDPFDIQITTVDETCPDSNDGQASVVVTGGVAPYTYSWLPFPNTGTSVTGLNSGTYNLTVTDDNGCTQSEPYTINQEPDWSVTLTPTSVSCNGGADGEITSSGVVGGTPPYTFLWAPDGQVTENISGLDAGAYTLTVTDDIGCTFTPPAVQITQPSPISITETHTNVTCDGLNNGAINISVSGGTAPFTYSWSNGAITQDLTGLAAGFYLVTVTDDNGCTASLPVTITDGSTLLVSYITISAACGASDGGVNLTVVGGSGNYGYTWTPGNLTTQNISGIPAGIYDVTVVDNILGCSEQVTVFVNNFPGHTVDGVVTDGTNCVSNNGSIDMTVTDGSGDFTYNWAHGPVTEDLNGLPTGTYTVTVTDNITGCISFGSFTVQAGNELVVSSVPTPPSCGLINGAINISVSGGTAPYSFVWSTGATTEDISGLGAGLYTVTVTDLNGCSFDTTLNLNNQGSPTVTGTPTSPTCTGTANGSINLVVSGGVGPFTFNWSNGATTQNLANLSGETYTVIITDKGTGCQVTQSFTLTTPPNLGGQVNITPVGCFGGTNGSIDVTLFGGTSPYTVVWNPGNIMSEDLTNVAAGTYIAVATDASGCSITGQFTINQSPQIVLTETHVNVSCSGANNGSINLSVSGGVGPYTYAWLPNGQVTQDLSNLGPGIYSVTVTDSQGCTRNLSVTITEPNTFNLNPTFTNATCNGACNGTASVNVTGGTLPYTYVWTPNVGNGPSVSNLCGGSYQVLVTDANGCSNVAQFTISDNQMQVSVASTNVSCNGDCDGTATATVTGSNPPFSYLWQPSGNTGLTQNNLCAGTYTFTATDNIGCSIQQTVTITEPAPIVLTLDVTDVSCNGASDGSIDLTVTGGTAPYTYQWFPGGQTTQDINNLPVGNYSVVVTDANGCTSSQITLGGSFAGGTLALPDGNGVSYNTSIAITGFPVNSTITTATDLQDICINMEHSYLGDLQMSLTCPNGQTVILKQYPGGGGTYLGAANDAGTNGVPGVGADYCFSATATLGTLLQENTNGNWVTAGNLPNNSMTPGTYSPFQSFNGFIGCPLNGNWTVTVTDNLAIDDGFIFDWSLNFGGSGSNDSLATVNEPAPIQITSSVVEATCGVCDGSVTVVPSNGQAPYSYLWNTGATTATLNNICAGIYQVQVTDANGCINSFFIPVDNSSGPSNGNPVVTNASCFGLCDGAATLNATGGNAPYTYQWVPGGQNTNSVTGLCPGSYFVQIQDADGCIYTEPITIGSPAQIQIGQTVTNSTCGLCDGEITLTPITGTAPYSYDWSPAVVGNVPNATGLCAGVYNITVTDGTGCEEPVTVLLNDFPSATLFVTGIAPTCDATCNGSATVVTSGGNAPFSYLWDDTNAQTTPVATALCEGLYTVTVTGADGCVSVGQTTLTAPDPIGLSLLIIDNGTCAGACDGAITVIPSGGTIPFTYQWNDPASQTTSTASNLCAGTYDVIVTDANGCTDVVSGTVNNPVGLTATVVGTDVSCNGTCNGTATVSIVGGTAPFTYLWDDPASQTTATAVGLCDGTYSVTVTDANNCDFTVSITIAEPTPLVVTISNVVNLQCNGICVGEATANISGGVGPYTIVWSDPSAQTTQTATGLCASSYTVTVTDANGCVRTATVSITGPGGLTSSITSQVNATCNGTCNGTATVTATGGTGPYNYQWNDPANQTGPTATGLCPGPTSVTVTDANGCISVSTVIIIQPGILNASTTANDPDCFGFCDGTSTAFTTGGTFPYSYLWNDPNGQTTITATNLCPGPYSVTVTDANGCVSIANVNIFQPTEIIANTTVVNATCGQCNGQASVSPTGGVQPYTYLWGNGQTTATVTGLCPGVYNVNVTDQFGCVENFIIPVNTTGGPTSATVTVNDASCFGACNGSATISGIVGGIAPYTYQWVPGGQTTASANGLCAGTYNVQVIDSAGCIFTQPVTINEPAQIIPAYVSTPATCGTSNGAITVNPTGGDGGPYTFVWSPNVSNSASASGLAAGVYTVTITDGSNCSTTVVIPVNSTSGPTLSGPQTNVTCNGTCDGTATVTIVGGVAPYTILWNDPSAQTTATAVGLCAGQYSVTVTDASGCVTVRQYNITEPSEIAVSVPLITDASCPGACDGVVTIVASGGTLPYTVSWSPSGGNLATATGLCAGVYVATITDANGCAETVSVTVDEPDPIVINTSTQDASCFGVCDGEAYASATGGAGGFTYQWNNPLATANDTVTGLCAGTYDVIATDAAGCQDTAQVTINEPASIVVTPSTQAVTCFGDCDGEVYVTATGGTAPYTYQWNDPASTQNDTVVGLCAGIYNVIVTDANGCTSASAAIITQPLPLLAIGQGTNITCGGQCDGIATVVVQGGTGPYSYLWDDPNAQTTPVATNLCAGTYTVTVTDANGCTTTASVTIIEPPVLVISVSTTNASCGGVCDGSATVTITGGTGPYVILWSNLGVGNTINGLCAGQYSVIVTDANFCTQTVNFQLTEPPVLNANITSTVQVLCAGSCTGQATVQGSGGTPTYSFQWSNGQTTPTVGNLCVGTYSVIITDGIGCTATATVTINDNGALAATVPIVTPVSCNGGCNATATAFAVGGVGPYTYSWNDPFNQSGATATGLCAGTYTVTVVDSQSPACTTQATVIIAQPPLLTTASVGVDETCGGACNGTATALPQGGTPPYSYLWNDPSNQTTVTAIGLCVGTYTVSVTDANGCVAQSSVTVSGPPALVSNATTTASTCSNVANGGINLTVAGGVGSYTFAWSPGGANTEDLTNVLFGPYTVTITDNTGCQLTSTYSIGTLTNIEADAGQDVNLCVGNSIELDGDGGGTYLWSPAETLSNTTVANPTANPVVTTTYILNVTIGNCVDADTVLVTMYDIPTVDAGNDVTIPTGGTIGLNANGAITGWQYTWTPVESLNDPNVTNPFASPEETTTYYVTVTDQNGCTNMDSIIVEVVPGIKFPDGISPNGDGINDTWVIDNIELFQDAIVEIYNRWGQMLWQSAPGYPVQWDGRYDGNDLPVGTYYYVIRSVNFEQPFTGPITIVR